MQLTVIIPSTPPGPSHRPPLGILETTPLPQLKILRLGMSLLIGLRRRTNLRASRPPRAHISCPPCTHVPRTLNPRALNQRVPSPCALKTLRPLIRNLGEKGRSSAAKNKMESQGLTIQLAMAEPVMARLGKT